MFELITDKPYLQIFRMLHKRMMERYESPAIPNKHRHFETLYKEKIFAAINEKHYWSCLGLTDLLEDLMRFSDARDHFSFLKMNRVLSEENDGSLPVESYLKKVQRIVTQLKHSILYCSGRDLLAQHLHTLANHVEQLYWVYEKGATPIELATSLKYKLKLMNDEIKTFDAQYEQHKTSTQMSHKNIVSAKCYKQNILADTEELIGSIQDFCQRAFTKFEVETNNLKKDKPSDMTVFKQTYHQFLAMEKSLYDDEKFHFRLLQDLDILFIYFNHHLLTEEMPEPTSDIEPFRAVVCERASLFYTLSKMLHAPDVKSDVFGALRRGPLKL